MYTSGDALFNTKEVENLVVMGQYEQPGYVCELRMAVHNLVLVMPTVVAKPADDAGPIETFTYEMKCEERVKAIKVF